MKFKKFVYDENKPPIHYREGTSDEAIIQTVLIERKEYLFPTFSPKIVYDIGANIGIVSIILATIYPNAKIYAFEPVKENFDLLQKNTQHLPNVVRINAGLGSVNEDRTIYESEDPNNLGGFSTEIIPNFDTDGQDIRIISVADFCQEHGGPDLIKIDCEGAEFEILSHLPGLDNCKWITGELHGVNEYRLLEMLDRLDFRLSFDRRFMDKVWHFHGVSKHWTDFGLDSQQN